MQLARTLCDKLDVPVVNGVGTLSLMHSAALLSRCRLLISNDSGLMHMATALQVPVVAIFGPTVQEFGFYPFQARAEVVSEPLPCRPCSTKGSVRLPAGSSRLHARHLQCSRAGRGQGHVGERQFQYVGLAAGVIRQQKLYGAVECRITLR